MKEHKFWNRRKQASIKKHFISKVTLVYLYSSCSEIFYPRDFPIKIIVCLINMTWLRAMISTLFLVFMTFSSIQGLLKFLYSTIVLYIYEVFLHFYCWCFVCNQLLHFTWLVHDFCRTCIRLNHLYWTFFYFIV